jgi:hypothetical protein
LTKLRDQGWKRRLDDLVSGAATEEIQLSVHRNVYLLVYSYDADQRRGVLKASLDALNADTLLHNRIIAKGNPGAFSLAKDMAARLSIS